MNFCIAEGKVLQYFVFYVNIHYIEIIILVKLIVARSEIIDN